MRYSCRMSLRVQINGDSALLGVPQNGIAHWVPVTLSDLGYLGVRPEDLENALPDTIYLLAVDKIRLEPVEYR